MCHLEETPQSWNLTISEDVCSRPFPFAARVKTAKLPESPYRGSYSASCRRPDLVINPRDWILIESRQNSQVNGDCQIPRGHPDFAEAGDLVPAKNRQCFDWFDLVLESGAPMKIRRRFADRLGQTMTRKGEIREQIGFGERWREGRQIVGQVGKS
jgi:hypothetical protein